MCIPRHAGVCVAMSAQMATGMCVLNDRTGEIDALEGGPKDADVVLAHAAAPAEGCCCLPVDILDMLNKADHSTRGEAQMTCATHLQSSPHKAAADWVTSVSKFSVSTPVVDAPVLDRTNNPEPGGRLATTARKQLLAVHERTKPRVDGRRAHEERDGSTFAGVI